MTNFELIKYFKETYDIDIRYSPKSRHNFIIKINEFELDMSNEQKVAKPIDVIKACYHYLIINKPFSRECVDIKSIYFQECIKEHYKIPVTVKIDDSYVKFKFDNFTLAYCYYYFNYMTLQEFIIDLERSLNRE